MALERRDLVEDKFSESDVESVVIVAGEIGEMLFESVAVESLELACLVDF